MKMLEAEIETRKLPVFISEADLRLRRRLQARLHVLRVHKLDALVVGRDAHPLFGGGEVVEAALGGLEQLGDAAVSQRADAKEAVPGLEIRDLEGSKQQLQTDIT